MRLAVAINHNGLSFESFGCSFIIIFVITFTPLLDATIFLFVHFRVISPFLCRVAEHNDL